MSIRETQNCRTLILQVCEEQRLRILPPTWSQTEMRRCARGWRDGSSHLFLLDLQKGEESVDR